MVIYLQRRIPQRMDCAHTKGPHGSPEFRPGAWFYSPRRGHSSLQPFSHEISQTEIKEIHTGSEI